ncbi:hypothetical protein ACFL2T_00365 [Elusimicrobiota bacterium]
MSRSARREMCTYCDRESESRDHVPPKCFLKKPLPSDLQTVPSCKECNLGTSKDEQYLLVLMAMTSKRTSLSDLVGEAGAVDRALERSVGLDERMIESLRPEGERVALEPDLPRVSRVLKKIASGLISLHGIRVFPGTLGGAVLYPLAPDARPLPVKALSHSPGNPKNGWMIVQKGIFSYRLTVGPTPHQEKVVVMDFHRAFWGVALLPRST